MRKVLVMALALAFVFALAGITLAANPTTYNATYGYSAWTYGDKYDADNALPNLGKVKTEGSYRAYDDSTTALYDYDGDLTQPDVPDAGPHGGYATTSNKCKTCHAVHRADGIYMLLRADQPDTACDFCHIGAGIHSNRQAYYGSSSNKYTSNGHTIGAGPEIPDSSVWQLLTPKTLTSADEATSTTVNAREYNANKNKIFKLKARHGLNREGPVLLQCMTCHQVHNASRLVWKPDGVNTYKLLRNAPSASVDSETVMTQYKTGSLNDSVEGKTGMGNAIFAVESTLSADTTGPGKTIYTQWQGTTAIKLVKTSLSVWCADCHNLNIGTKKTGLPSAFGGRSHVDRTHPVPYMVANYGAGKPNAATGEVPQCYSCHVTDLYPRGICGDACHITPAGYEPRAAKSDFPHAGAEASAKLLGGTQRPGGWIDTSGNDTSTPFSYGTDQVGNNITGYFDKAAYGDSVDPVCLRCHEDIGYEQ